jgi:hypothetical protein
MANVDTSALIAEAKPAQAGRLTRRELNDVLDKHFGA